MSTCKSCGMNRIHKAWCMRPAPVLYQPTTVHAARDEFLVMCA